MIKLKKIYKSYQMAQNKLDVLKDIDLHIKRGEFISIMGPSGSGKSTLLNVIGILDGYDSGEYYLNGNLIKNLGDNDAALFRREYVSFIFQFFNLLQDKSALENIALPLYYKKIKRKERNRIAYQYLEQMGLRDFADHTPLQLSGGQQQRVAIARALISQPRIILADEPTGTLDSQNSKGIMKILKDINKNGVTILIVTHDIDVAKMAKRNLCIKDGCIVNEHL